MSAVRATRLAASAAFIAGIAGCASLRASGAPDATRLTLVTHAAFFSQETQQVPALDPQVFVVEAGAPAGVGPQGIRHIAGMRNALLTDPATAPIYNANGVRLEGFTLGSWLAATGTVTLVDSGPGNRITVVMQGLRASGVYSLFENHFDQKPVGFTPLDGTSLGNTFVTDAKGGARITVVSPQRLTHDNAVLIVYHSDGQGRGMERGTIGVDAHHQLIVRIPD